MFNLVLQIDVREPNLSNIAISMITNATLCISGEDKLGSTKRHKMSKEICVKGI